MKELIIDTSSNLLYVGLIDDSKKDFITRVGKNDNAAYLVDHIDQLLKKNNLTINDIETIIVGVGPGSYTGARVGVVVAKTLAYSKGIELKQISSLNLLSSGYSGNVTAAIDARRKHYFVGTFNNGKVIKSDSYELVEDINNLTILDETTIKVDLSVVSLQATRVDDVFGLEPNYLRKTEAETNYDKKNDN